MTVVEVSDPQHRDLVTVDLEFAASANVQPGGTAVWSWRLDGINGESGYVTPDGGTLQRIILPEGASRIGRPLPMIGGRAYVIRTLPEDTGTAELEGGYLWTNDRRLHHAQPFTLEETQIRSFFERVACPVLLVWASEGLHKERSRLAARVGYFRDVRAVEVAGRHHVHMDDAPRVAREIIGFLR